jgi:hypothetical protein
MDALWQRATDWPFHLADPDHPEQLDPNATTDEG